MKLILLSVILTVSSPLLAYASPETSLDALKKSIAECAAKSGELKKLSCYDRIAKNNSLVTTTTPASTAGKGKWKVDIKSNPLDDSKTIVARITADSGSGTYGDSISMILRCQSNKTEGYINWGSFMGTDGVSVTTRVGSEDATTTTWSGSSDHKATFIPGNDIKFITKLLGNNKFVAQATPYSDSPITAVFDIKGINNAVKDLRETCNW